MPLSHCRSLSFSAGHCLSLPSSDHFRWSRRGGGGVGVSRGGRKGAALFSGGLPITTGQRRGRANGRTNGRAAAGRCGSPLSTLTRFPGDPAIRHHHIWRCLIDVTACRRRPARSLAVRRPGAELGRPLTMEPPAGPSCRRGTAEF